MTYTEPADQYATFPWGNPPEFGAVIPGTIRHC